MFAAMRCLFVNDPVSATEIETKMFLDPVELKSIENLLLLLLF